MFPLTKIYDGDSLFVTAMILYWFDHNSFHTAQIKAEHYLPALHLAYKMVKKQTVSEPTDPTILEAANNILRALKYQLPTQRTIQ